MRAFKPIFIPISFLYAIVTFIRNWLFDIGLLKQKKYKFPIISLGNLSAGGTGKTPHSEFLIQYLLSAGYQIAYLSRGYGRKTKGLKEVQINSLVTEVGDEALQIKKKFEEIPVCVCESRRKGIEYIRRNFLSNQIIILDDAFQHRWVKPGLNILLTTYSQPFYKDYFLPAGNLRESASGAKRANVIIFTKCPDIISPIERKAALEELKPNSLQQVFFSYTHYGNFIPFLRKTRINLGKEFYFDRRFSIVLFSGIADSTPIHYYLKRYAADIEIINFPDHHQFYKQDIDRVIEVFETLPKKDKIIVTTEKDIQRLHDAEIQNILRNYPFFYLPIEVKFHHQDQEEFLKIIQNYVNEHL
jgi:tetraacyldisaccharide 4'-kinase